MCGLISYVGTEDYSVDKLKILFLLNEHRGKDSCGAYIKGKGTIKVEGECSKVFLPHIHIPTSNLFLGHVRQGTISTKTKENSHPFVEENLIQIHNGKIDNYISVAGKLELGNDYKVDSQVMLKTFRKFQKDGEADFIEKGLHELEGPIAMMLYDKLTPNLLYFFRNIERPLFYGEITPGNYYFSSIEEALLIIGVSKENVYNVEVNQIYVLDVEKNTITKTPFVKKPKPVVYHETKKLSLPQHTINITKPSTISFNNAIKLYNRVMNVVETSMIDETPIKKNTVVEFLSDDGKVHCGKVIACCLPFNNIYVIIDDDSRFSFVDRSLITETEEDVTNEFMDQTISTDDQEILNSLSTGSYLSYYNDDGGQAVGKISYVDMRSGTILLDLPTKKGNTVEFDEIKPGSIISNVDKFQFDAIQQRLDTFVYECGTCGDEGVVNGRACPSCKSEFFEEIVNEHLLNYDDYRDAIDLFCALSAMPSFSDETGEFNDILEEDSALSTRIKNYRKEMSEEEPAYQKEWESRITDCMNRRVVLLERMKTLAKDQEQLTTLLD